MTDKQYPGENSRKKYSDSQIHKMRCPQCQKLANMRVVQRWVERRGLFIIRRRICPCELKHKCTTYEVFNPMGKFLMTLDNHLRKMMYKVYKRKIDFPHEWPSLADETVDLERIIQEQKEEEWRKEFAEKESD